MVRALGVFDEVLVYVKLRRLARILKFCNEASLSNVSTEGKTKRQTDLYICC